MIAGFLNLLAGLWSWLGRIMAAIGRWLREPHDWWRIGFVALALGFTCASFVAWDARQTIVVVQRECDAKLAEAQSVCSVIQSQTRTIVQQVNAEAARRIAQAERDKRDVELARKVAEGRAQELKIEAGQFDAKMREARKNPTCDTLLNADVGAICGL